MAKKEEKKLDYRELQRDLEREGLQRLYLLWGEEEHLKNRFRDELLALALPEGSDDFNYKRISESTELDVNMLAGSVDAMPFMAEHTVVEVQDVDLNNVREENVAPFLAILEDIPEYCTVIFIQNASFIPDGRLKSIKTIKKIGKEIEFTASREDALYEWISQRFAQHGKTISLESIRHFIFTSGNLMNRLDPEIEKIAAYAKEQAVTIQDIDAVATRILEANVFLITDSISRKDPERAVLILADLLEDRSNDPIALLALVGNQMRKLYAARLAIEKGLGTSYVEEVCNLSSYPAGKTLTQAKGFRLRDLQNALDLCCLADYEMKSSSIDNKEILKELIMRICAGIKV